MTAKLPQQPAAEAALAERQRLVASEDHLLDSRKAPAAQLAAARAVLDQYDRSDTRSPEIVGRRVKARSDLRQAENDLEIVDNEIAALYAERKANDEALQAVMDGGLGRANSDLRAALISDVNSALAALAPQVAAVVKRAIAINAATGMFGDLLNGTVLAAADGYGRTFVANRRMRVEGSEQVERLDLTWRDNPKLVAEFEALRAIEKTVTAVHREVERITRERDADPEWQKKRFADDQERRRRESDERIKQVAEVRARAEAEEAARAQRVTRASPETIIRQPGSPAPRRIDAVRSELDDYHSPPATRAQPANLDQR